MSRIGPSGQGTGSSAETGGARPQAGQSRASRFDDRPKDAGGRDAGLRRHAGAGSHQHPSQADDPRAALFGRTLDGALSREERDGRRGGRGEAGRDDGHDSPEAGEGAAGLLAAGGLMAPPARTGAAWGEAGGEAGQGGIGAAGRRPSPLASLWAQDPGAPVAEAGRAAPTEDDGPRVGPGGGAEDRRLLAEAVAPDPSALAVAASASVPLATGTPAGAAEAGAAVRPSTAARVDGIADRVERAVRAEEGVAPGQPVTIQVPLDAAGDGLRSLTVTVTAAGVDVTLARVAGEASADLQAAARALVERLQRRFPKGAVRVFDTVEAAGEAGGAPGRLAAARAPDRDDL